MNIRTLHPNDQRHLNEEVASLASRIDACPQRSIDATPPAHGDARMTRTTPPPQPHELEAHRTEALRAAVAAGSVPEETREIARLRAAAFLDALETRARAGSRAAQETLDDIHDAETIDDFLVLYIHYQCSLARLMLPIGHPERPIDDDGALRTAWRCARTYARLIAMTAGVIL